MIRKQRERDVVIQVPFGLRCLGRVPPVGLSGAGRRGLRGEAVAVDAIAPFVAAFGREHSYAEAKWTITQHEFGDVDVAHGWKLAKPERCS